MDKVKKFLSSNYFIFFISFICFVISIYNVDIILSSGDASDTLKVVKSLLSDNIYGSYVMYKGFYAFLPGLISYIFSNLTGLSIFFLWKIFKSLAFAYIVTIGIPFMFEKIFKIKITAWQKYLFAIFLFILEKATFYLLSVDLTNTVLLILAINQTIKLTEKYSHKLCFVTGLIYGAGTCLSGQYSISIFILIFYLLIIFIKKFKKNYKKIILVLLILTVGFCITKSVDIVFEKEVVDKCRERGDWIPSKSHWFHHGLSGQMTYITYPPSLEDKLSLAVAKADSEESYNILMNGIDAYSVRHYIKLIINHPIAFVVRWTERLFLGLINDPIGVFGMKSAPIWFVIPFMGICLYVLMYYLKKNTKKVKDLFSLPAFILYSILFSALVPSFGHVENRYYFTARIALIGILILSPLIPNYINKIKNKKVKFTNINMELITCIIFVIICLVAYFAIYQNMSDIILQN